MKLLPVQRASSLSLDGPQTQWLIEELWGEDAVGILGGEPKCCKSFLALDMAVLDRRRGSAGVSVGWLFCAVVWRRELDP